MEYFILKPDGEQTGTYSLDQVRAMLNSGFIGPDTRYWHEGISEWQSIERLEESVNFPEPDPHTPHAPPPHQWPGSLARAIPSPHQQKRPPVIEPAAPGVPAPPAVPAVPGVPRPAAEIPTPSRPLGPTPSANGVTAGTAPARETSAGSLETPPARNLRRRLSLPRLPRLPRPTATQLYTTCSILLALAILAAVVASRHPARSVYSQVTLLSHNNCVLLHQSDIKPFEDEMHDAPVVARLKGVIATSNDNAFVETASNGLQDEIIKHETAVTQKYLQAGKARVIETGPYHTVGYLDDTGALVIAHAGAPWAAIVYHDAVVYAYLGSDFHLRPQ